MLLIVISLGWLVRVHKGKASIVEPCNFYWWASMFAVMCFLPSSKWPATSSNKYYAMYWWLCVLVNVKKYQILCIMLFISIFFQKQSDFLGGIFLSEWIHEEKGFVNVAFMTPLKYSICIIKPTISSFFLLAIMLSFQLFFV